MTGGFVPLQFENSTTINVELQTNSSKQVIFIMKVMATGSITKGCALKPNLYIHNWRNH